LKVLNSSIEEYSLQGFYWRI